MWRKRRHGTCEEVSFMLTVTQTGIHPVNISALTLPSVSLSSMQLVLPVRPHHTVDVREEKSVELPSILLLITGSSLPEKCLSRPTRSVVMEESALLDEPVVH